MCTDIRVLFHRHIFAASVFPWLHVSYFLRCANVGFIPYFCIVEWCMCHGVYSFAFVSLLLFCTVLCLVSFTCIIFVFSQSFFVCICFYVYGLSTVECFSYYLCLTSAVCVFVPLLVCIFAFFYFVYIHLFY